MNEPKAAPMYCPVCKARGTYYGRLVFPNELAADALPKCPNHEEALAPALVSARTTK